MKIKTLLFCTFLALSILLIYRGHVYAAPEALTVSPAIEELSIIPGTTTSYTLTIANTADRPVGIHADVTGFQTTDEGKENNLSSSPLISWTRIEPTDLIIPSQEKKTLTVTITPPNSLEKGGYYAAIFLTPFISKQKVPTTPVVLTRIGTLLLAQYGTTDYTNLKEKTIVKDFSFTRLVAETAPFDFHFTVANTYFTHFTAKPFLTLTPLFGPGEKLQLEEKHILPGKSKVWSVSISPRSFSFFYKAHLAVSVGAGNYITADTWFVVIPGLRHILLILILIFLALVATFHKRARKVVGILLRG